MLSHIEVRARLVRYGPNVLPEKQHFSAISIFAHQFASPLIFVLLAAVGVTVILGDFVDAAVIGSAVLINTILGFIQEYKAETTIAALKKILTPQAKVVRDGKTMMIPASELVQGDTVILSPGDHVPADGKVVEAVSLFINEAMITGESLPVEKRRDVNIFMGTVVAAGRGKMEVVATAAQTMIGKMARKGACRNSVDSIRPSLSFGIVLWKRTRGHADYCCRYRCFCYPGGACGFPYGHLGYRHAAGDETASSGAADGGRRNIRVGINYLCR